MWERHDERLGTDEKHREHVASTYLSKDPLKLGGRVVGLPGQSGSNNGGEKKGGGIKDRWRRITKRLASDVMKSPVFIVAAIAKDLMMSPDISDFAWKPVRSIHDYDLLRRINKFVLEDKAANLPCDVQYMMVTPYQSHTQLMDPSGCIGNPCCSCSVHMPTASRVYTSLRGMEESSNNGAESWLENDTVDTNEAANTLAKCRTILNKHMTPEKKVQLKKSLVQNLFSNIAGRKKGESLRAFANRRFQRNPKSNTTKRTVSRISGKKTKKVKATKKGPSELELKRQSDKYGDTGDKKKKNKVGPKKKKDAKVAGKKLQSSEEEVFLYWTDEFNESDIMEFLFKNGVIDEEEVDLRLESMMEEKERIGPSRQLGDWIQIDINHVTRRITCNCEDYNFDGTCFHQAMFEVLQFGILPESDYQYDHEQWDGIRKKCIEVLKKTYLL